MYFTLKGGAGTQTVTDGAVSDGGLAVVSPNQLFNIWSYFRVDTKFLSEIPSVSGSVL